MLSAERPRLRWRSRVYLWARALHLYLSLLAFLAILFFALTGLTLNHPDWFGEGRAERRSGSLQRSYLEGGQVDWLRLDEDLRALGLRGQVTDYGRSGEEAWVSFRAPGYAADVQVNLRSGAYRLSLTQAGLVAAMNDLHRGRDAPGFWRWALDLWALFLALVSLSGLLLGLYLPKTRRASLLALGLGLALFGGLALFAVR